MRAGRACLQRSHIREGAVLVHLDLVDCVVNRVDDQGETVDTIRKAVWDKHGRPCRAGGTPTSVAYMQRIFPRYAGPADV